MTSGVYKRTEETKRRMGERQKGEKNYMYGKKLSKSHRSKISLVNKGKVFSKETIRRRVETRRENGNYFVSKKTRRKMSERKNGKKLSEEHKKNISKSLQGREVSLETRRRISIAHKGKTMPPMTAEARRNRSKATKGKKNSFYGKHHSKESKRKNSEAHKGEKNYNWLGGKSFEPYDIKFSREFKRFIRDRDNQICMLCNIHREKLSKALAVHHINYNKLNTIQENCISLCNGCNIKVNFNRDEWIVFFQSLLSKRYGYEY